MPPKCKFTVRISPLISFQPHPKHELWQLRFCHMDQVGLISWSSNEIQYQKLRSLSGKPRSFLEFSKNIIKFEEIGRGLRVTREQHKHLHCSNCVWSHPACTSPPYNFWIYRLIPTKLTEGWRVQKHSSSYTFFEHTISTKKRKILLLTLGTLSEWPHSLSDIKESVVVWLKTHQI